MLTALKEPGVARNKLPSTEVEFIIESFPRLTELRLYGLGLTGEHLCSTNCALTTLPAAVPKSIGQLHALKELYLRGNKIAGAYSCSTSTTPHIFLHHRRREGPREGSPPQLHHLLLSPESEGRAAMGHPARSSPPVRADLGSARLMCARGTASRSPSRSQ